EIPGICAAENESDCNAKVCSNFQPVLNEAKGKSNNEDHDGACRCQQPQPCLLLPWEIETRQHLPTTFNKGYKSQRGLKMPGDIKSVVIARIAPQECYAEKESTLQSGSKDICRKPGEP